MKAIVANRELNCRGMRCPLPVIYTRKALTTMPEGEVLKMVATDPGVVEDIAEFTRRSGARLLAHSEDAGDFVFFLSAESAKADEQAAC